MRLLLTFLIVALFAKTGYSQTNDSVKTTAPIFTFVEQMPVFPGGDAALVKFLQQNLKYPQMERDNDIQGKVLLRFVVLENGSVDDVIVIKGVSPGLDAEAMRVIKLMPKFTPGRQQGKPVKVYYNIPIVFKLQDQNPKEDAMLNAKITKDADFRNGILELQNSNYKKASGYIKKSIKKYPDDYISYDILGEIDLKLGNKKEACKNFEQALKKGSPDAQNSLNSSCK
ncbi:MAG TPA: TonB family protein [Chitinophagales bacterium]|nr:TonB family protein [Chitinophagales bacterium]